VRIRGLSDRDGELFLPGTNVSDTLYSVSIGVGRDKKAFHESVEEYLSRFMDPFAAFCEEAIPRKLLPVATCHH
jgi:hypothetical protein